VCALDEARLIGLLEEGCTHGHHPDAKRDPDSAEQDHQRVARQGGRDFHAHFQQLNLSGCDVDHRLGEGDLRVKPACKLRADGLRHQAQAERSLVVRRVGIKRSQGAREVPTQPWAGGASQGFHALAYRAPRAQQHRERTEDHRCVVVAVQPETWPSLELQPPHANPAWKAPKEGGAEKRQAPKAMNKP
jgi:hypothetical protein